MSWYETPIGRAIGSPSKQAAFAGLGLVTAADLLRHYPRRYERWGELTPLAQLPLGQEVTILAEVVSAVARPMKTKQGHLLHVVVSDGEANLALTFFNARKLQYVITPGKRGLFSGTVTLYNRDRQLTHPKMLMLSDGIPADQEADRPIPIYPASAALGSEVIRKAVRVVLDGLGDVPDPIPAEVRARRGLSGLREALFAVHRPATEADWQAARTRLRFEEAFVLQTALARRRWVDRARPATPRARVPGGLLDAFEKRLPFDLTAGQLEVGEEIAADLAREYPMHRLLQGEVGSGKTVVALRAMLTVVDGGGQAALLAPTEVLAAQHLRTITELMGDLAAGGMLGGDERGTRLALLTGSQGSAARRRALLAAASGDAGIVVGTHALLQDAVEFFDLGLVVVDEQHRFGVEQRDALRGKGRTDPHLLVMTATPIPRTVAMTVFGDLETSTLAELPAGRAPVTTHVVPVGERPQWLERAWHRVREEVDAGHQAYVVCARIGDGEEPDQPAPDDAGEPVNPRPPAAAVLEVLPLLRQHPAMAGLRVEMLHGRMASEDRDAVMAGFGRGDVDVLVATTVIEVGVDVANATAMVVMDAERFGVSQLHQLRGRVGRSAAGGLCLLVTASDPGTPARDRLDAVAASLDGFALARIDLDQRREGDVLGAAQSGTRSSLRLLRVLRDESVIEQARHDATAVVAADPDLARHPALARAISDLLDPEREAYLERG